MSREKQGTAQTENRWVRVGRVGVLALTMAGPVVNTIAELFRQRSPSREEYAEGVQEGVGGVKDEAAARLDELVAVTRKRVAEQIRQLRAQAKQLRKGLRQVPVSQQVKFLTLTVMVLP